MVRLNDDVELVTSIRQQLADNKKQYGKPYCPCRIQHTDDTVCMCKEFKEQESGECHCGLYVKE